MFIREVKKQRSKDSGIYYQYQLVQSERIEGKARQRIILYLGSDPLLHDKENRVIVLAILKAKIFQQPELFPRQTDAALNKLADEYYKKYRIRYNLGEQGEQQGKAKKNKASIPPLPYKADYHQIDIKSLELTEARSFGAEHLCLQVLEKLELGRCFKQQGVNEEMIRKALMSIAAKAIFAASEHKTAQLLNMNSELAALSGFDRPVNHKELYAVTDELYRHKEAIDRFIYNRITDMFSLRDKLFIFDISNTYFEGAKRKSKLAHFGRSKEKRNDCKLVVFTGVINAAGFIRHSRIYEGNKTDSQTLADMLADLEKHTSASSPPIGRSASLPIADLSKEKQTVVIDAGIATEENLKLIVEKGYHYVGVSRKRLKDYPLSEDKQTVYRLTDRGKEKVKLSVFYPKGHDDCWMYVQSPTKRKKEQSIDTKLNDRFEQGLETIQKALTTKGGTKRIEKVWERIGRLKEKYKRPAARYAVKVKESAGKAVEMSWKMKDDPVKEDKSEGVYFIRTSHTDPTEGILWAVYNTIREVESTFRCFKTDLNIRPVYHKNDERVEAHLYLTILAYQLVNTIRYQLKQSGLNYDWKNIVRIMSTQMIQTVVLPTDKKSIHLRKPSKPIKEVEQIYKITRCKDTQKPVKKYVVYH